MGISTSGYEKINADVTAAELNPAFVPNDENSADSEYTVTLSYTKEIDAREGAYNIGETVEIRYDPKDPNSIAIGDMSLPVMIAIGAAAVVIGGLVIFRGLIT